MKKLFLAIFLMMLFTVPTIAGDNDMKSAPCGATSSNPCADFVTKGPCYDPRSVASFNVAVANIGSTPTTMCISNNQTLTASVTAPSTLQLNFLQGGMITTAGYQITIGNLRPSNSVTQIFNGTGVTILPGATEKLTSEMWGAKGDLITDDYTSLQTAINTSSNQTPLILLNRGYKSNTSLSINTNFNKLKGQGIASVIWGNHSNPVLQVGNGVSERVGISVEDMYLWSPTEKGY